MLHYKQCAQCLDLFSNERNQKRLGRRYNLYGPKQFNNKNFCSVACSVKNKFIPNKIVVIKKICYLHFDNNTLISLFDEIDLNVVSKIRWRIDSTGYVGNTKYKRLHQFLFGNKPGMVIDHINRNPLDNRRCNLRFVSHKDNIRNNKGKGYYMDGSRKKWVASIVVDGRNIYLGRYTTEEEALIARMLGEEEYWGSIKTR